MNHSYCIWKILIVIIVGSIVPNLRLDAQCGFVRSILIPDTESENFIVSVSNVLNDDLSLPSQGVCGITLHFNHNSIGDWEGILTSPSGQSIVLIGPSGLYGETIDSDWDISFVTCSENAIPDLGFQQSWNSDQSWGTDNSFNGSYYPSQGCLEDFNLGPVNGSWTLFVSDNNSFDEGNLLGFSLTFCDESPGQNCNLCEAEGGELTSAVNSACEGDVSLNLNLAPSFVGPGPDPSLYTYTFLVVENDIVQLITNTGNLVSLMAGNYIVYGISYNRNDALNLPSIGDVFSDFELSLDGEFPPLCGVISDNSLPVEIYDVPPPTMLTESICIGDAYVIGDSIFTTPGIKNITLRTVNNCDSVVIIDLAVINVVTSLLGPNELDCTTAMASITFDGIPLAQLDSLIWFNDDATFYDNSFTGSILVDQPGEYFAEFSFRGCVDTISKVINDANLPPLMVFTDTITCANGLNGQIRAQSSANVTYSWTFNNLPFANIADPIVRMPGIYEVAIMEIGTGCLNRGSVEVLEDVLPPPISITGGSLTCTTTSITLQLSTRLGSSASWTGPLGFTSNLLNPTVTNPGLYGVTVTGPNGCVNFGSVLVDDIVRPFGLNFDLDSISCSDVTADISFTSTLGNVSAIWTSPSNQVFNGRSQSFSEAGIYQLDIESSDMCDTTLTIEIVADTISPIISLIGDTVLNCSNQELNINAVVIPNNALTVWTFPDMTTSNQSMITTDLPGLYIIQATSTNGCMTTDSIVITRGNDLPDPMTILDSFNCQTDTVTLRAFESSDFNYQWSDGVNNLGTNASQRIVQAGYHYLLIENITNGCRARYAYDISIDLTFSPAEPLINYTLNCMDSVLTLGAIPDDEVLEYSWFLNNVPFSMDSMIEIREAGTYRVDLKYSSLCDETLSSIVSIDTALSDLSLNMVDTLTCINTFADLIATSSNAVTFNWFFNDLFLVDQNIVSVTVPGNYIMQATGANFCVTIDTIQVIQDISIPDFSIRGDTINCAESKVNLSIDTIPDRRWSLDWTGPNSFMSLDSAILVRDTGLYNLTVTGYNGCTTLDSFTVIGDFELPVSNAEGGSLNCIDSSLELSGFTTTFNSVLTWFGPQGFTSMLPNPIVFDTGSYVLLVDGPNGCSIKDTVHVDDMPAFPDAQVSLGLWDCSTVGLQVEASSSDSNVDFHWEGPNSYSFDGPSPIIPSFGNYLIEYTGINGCVTVIDTFIPTDTLRPYVEIVSDQLFRCEQRIITLRGDNSDQGSEYSYLWKTSLGLLLSDSTDQNILVGDTANYVLQVTNENNHCQNIAEYNVVETPSDLFDVYFTTENYGCLNGYNGRVIIDSIIGGGPPVLISFDNEPFVNKVDWNFLLPGDYTMQLRDTFGCRLDTVFEILDTLYLDLSIVQDTTINLGDSIVLNPFVTDLINISDAQFSWYPGQNLSCTNCPFPVVMPLVTTRYCVDVETVGGCQSTACILIRVNDNIEIFMPNVFTPNGDNVNDLIRPRFSDNVTDIVVFQVFDRWGNLLHEENNQNPDDLVGWDGRLDGVELTPQVFLYRFEYRTLANKINTQSGDFTLFR